MIYLDNAATTEIAPQVIKDITECMENDWGNPSSPYSIGQKSKVVLAEAKEAIAKTINASPEEIIFTSGGSEANNLAIKGTEYDVLFTTPVEHASVLKTAESFTRRMDLPMQLFPVDNQGLVKPDLAEQILSVYSHMFKFASGFMPFVSVGWVNNELGSVQDVKRIGEQVHKYHGIFHVDAVQAYSHIPIDVKEMGIDLMSVSGHKWGCPKGIGFLYKSNKVDLPFPLIQGGHQENGYRAGTENIPYIYAMGKRASEVCKEYVGEQEKELQRYLIGLLRSIRFKREWEITVNTPSIDGSYMPGILNCTMRHLKASELISFLDTGFGICIAAGAACSSYENVPSHVLQAIGLTDEEAKRTIRISFDKKTARKEIDCLINGIRHCLYMMGDAEND